MTSPAKRKSTRRRRLPQGGVNIVVFIFAALTILIALNYIANLPQYRIRMDATKTRSYSLSKQTTQLLDALEGNWEIALIVAADTHDMATREQIDEVLERYAERSDQITVRKIDPTDPAALADYEAMLTRLQSIYADDVRAYNEAIDVAEDLFQELLLFASDQSTQLEQLLSGMSRDDAMFQPLQQRLGLLTLLSQEGGAVAQAVADARMVSDAQPIPDYELARSIYAEALSQWGNELFEAARLFEAWHKSDGVGAAREYARAAEQKYDQMAQRLVAAADPLHALAPLELASIGRQMREGEAAIIIGPNRAAVVSSAQLFPVVSRRGVVSFDRRFRGEQMISATMGAMRRESMPLVVFVHAEDGSLLRQREQQLDVLGVASTLRASRYEISEWNVGAGVSRPLGRRGQPVVWIVVPPPARRSLEIPRAELDLITAARQLIDDGHATLLSFNPNPLNRYGQPDPWQKLTQKLGVEVDTARVIYQRVELPDGTSDVQRSQVVQRFMDDHVISRALHGQQAFFPRPLPIIVPEGSVNVSAVVSITPDASRWVEEQWYEEPSALDSPGEDEVLTEPVPIVAALKRPHPDGGTQRVIVVGSGGWMLSYIADAVDSIGGDRAALMNPGNQELMLASVAWLAGMDDMIAPSPLSQQVARLDGITPQIWLRWFALSTIGIPLLCLAAGTAVWLVRRL